MTAAHDSSDLSAPGRIEKFFVVLVLLLSTGAFFNLVMPSFQERTDASGLIVMQILWSVIYVVTLYLFFSKCQDRRGAISSIWPLAALCAFAFASVFWSDAPGLTFRRSVALMLTLFFGMYFASRFSMKEQLRLLAWTFGIGIAFSLPFGLLGLGASVDAERNVPGWYGIFTQKNQLGYMMVLSTLVFLFWGRIEPAQRRLARAAFVASLVLLVLSRSMTAAVTIALLLVLLPYLRWTLQKKAGWMVAGITSILAGGTGLLMYVATHLEQVTGMLGRSATLTGRVPLWILSVAVALRRPWLGYGYDAFWRPDDPVVQRIWQLLHWQPPHAHNGLLELWLEIGLVGMGLFLLIFAHYLSGALRFMRSDSGPASAWPLLFFLFVFCANLTEPFFLARNSIYFILYVATAAVTTTSRSESPSPVKTAVSQQLYA